MTTLSLPKTAAPKKEFFDLHITGLGYLNRVRQIKPKKGEPFVACDISALNGPTEAVEYQRFDVKVSGKEAQRLIMKCKTHVEQERKVLIGFRLGDPWIDQFTYTKGEKEGQPGASLKARLLFVSWIKIDGELVHKAETRLSDEAKSPANAPVPESTSSNEVPAPDQTPSNAVAETSAMAA